jgi:putative addiction module CopG family antidote
MEVNLPADLTQQFQTEVAAGRYPSASTLIEQALRRLTEQQRGTERLEALRRIGQAVDDAGLYGRFFLPEPAGTPRRKRLGQLLTL